MKFLQVLKGRRDVERERPEVSLTVAEGFREDATARIPRARLCESLRAQLNVVPGSLVRLSALGRVVNCRVGVSARDDEGSDVVRLNPRARKLLGIDIGAEVAAAVNQSPISSSAVPLEVGAAFKGDEKDAEPVVRVSKQMRTNLGLSRGDYVNIKSGEHQVPARVEVGAKDDAATARLNPMARGMLQVQVGDLVEVVPYETLVLLIDASGSMEEPMGFMTSKVKATRRAIDDLIDAKAKAKERDLLGIVSFGEECELISEPSSDFALVKRRARSITPCGRTAMFEGLAYTLELLEEAHGLRRTILLSDGCPTTTGDGLVLELALKAKQMGVVIDTIGVGGAAAGRIRITYDETLLRRIAEITGGKFIHVEQVKALEDEFLMLSEAKKIPMLTADSG
ncbi:MAG: VWA domain-containing protein [Leptospirillia bacterium]